MVKTSAAALTRLLVAVWVLLALAPAAEAAEETVQIRNYWRQTLLSADGDGPALGGEGEAAVWVVEPAGVSGAVRLRNAASGGYLHLEHDARRPEVGDAKPGWHSAMWILEPVAGGDLVRLRNLWRKTYLNVETGPVEAGEVAPGWHSARWAVTPAALPGLNDPPPDTPAGVVAVPVGGNAFLTDARGNATGSGARLDVDGLSHWQDPSVTATVYVRAMRPARREVSLIARSARPVPIEVEINGRRVTGTIDGRGWARYSVGTFAVKEGYLPIVVRQRGDDGRGLPEIRTVEISGRPDAFRFIDESFMGDPKSGFRFGRRGPSTHLKYVFPKNTDIEWFYSEITVPRGADRPGTYFEANGSASSYFGFQVNGPDLRKVLFSVWAPVKTDDPRQVPDHLRVRLERKGEGVDAGDFGNEGTGGSASVHFPWKPEVPYGFLTRIRPNDDGTTSYSAWFHDPEADDWHLIATFRRPETQTWHTFPYAFLENFFPDQGAVSRSARYGNQWARDREGRWHEITEATFTVDRTGNEEARLDFQGGVARGAFYLRGFGFFDAYTKPATLLSRPAGGQRPDIPLGRLARN